MKEYNPLIIPENSILNNLSKDHLPIKEYIYYRVIIDFIRMIQICYSRLFYCLDQSESNSKKDDIINEVWNIIDHFNRLRIVIGKAPGIKRNNTWYQLMSRTLKSVENARHFIQHYDNSLQEIINGNMTLYGHLSYYHDINEKEGKICTIIPGIYTAHSKLQMINPLGKNIRNKIDLITFFIGGEEINLSELLYKTQDFTKGLADHINKKSKKPFSP